MVFNSALFLVFFPIVLCVYYLVAPRLRWGWLLLASLYFYGVSAPAYLLQILVATAVTYWLARKIESTTDEAPRRRLTMLSVCLLLANLAVFKYTAFVNESLRALFGWVSLPYDLPVVRILLPIGISFYTFQLISYVVDVSRKTVPAERHLGVFALFVLFFPKMVAGPIERAKSLLPQLHKEQSFDYRQVVFGLQLMLWGAFKKVVVADRIAPIVGEVYGDPRAHDGVAMTAATLLFAVQVYTDFSGYSDIAVGAAQTFGYKLTNNFNRPYTAISIQDFWKRWHISLSNWLTDYVYTPLTRSRIIKLKWYYLMLLSLFLTFVASGLWHGAEWTFVAWGALHGLYLVCSMQTQKQRRKAIKLFRLDRAPRVHQALRIAYIFTLVCIAYVLFQSKSIGDAFYIFTHIPTGWGHAPASLRELFRGRAPELLYIVSGTFVVFGVEHLQGRVKKLRETIAARPAWVRWSLYYGLAVSIVLLGAFFESDQQFIYFQF